jgi:hypothetical protein
MNPTCNFHQLLQVLTKNSSTQTSNLPYSDAEGSHQLEAFLNEPRDYKSRVVSMYDCAQRRAEHDKIRNLVETILQA